MFDFYGSWDRGTIMLNERKLVSYQLAKGLKVAMEITHEEDEIIFHLQLFFALFLAFPCKKLGNHTDRTSGFALIYNDDSAFSTILLYLYFFSDFNRNVGFRLLDLLSILFGKTICSGYKEVDSMEAVLYGVQVKVVVEKASFYRKRVALYKKEWTRCEITPLIESIPWETPQGDEIFGTSFIVPPGTTPKEGLKRYREQEASK